jgi:hypothetical protein
LFLAELGRKDQYAAIYEGPLRSRIAPYSDILDGRWALVVHGTMWLIDSMERDDHGQRHDVAKGTMGAYINSSMVTGCAGSLLKGGNCKRVWFRHQYTDEFISRNPQLVQMALALTCETLPNTELLYPYPWKKQFQFSGEAQEASDGQMSETNSLVANDPQITARLASGANSCVDVQGYPAAIPDKRGLPKAGSLLAAGAARPRLAIASKRALRLLTVTRTRTDSKRRHSTDSSDSAASVELQASSTIRPPTIPPPTPITWVLLQVPTLPLYEHSDFLFQILHTNCLQATRRGLGGFAGPLFSNSLGINPL